MRSTYMYPVCCKRITILIDTLKERHRNMNTRKRLLPKAKYEKKYLEQRQIRKYLSEY